MELVLVLLLGLLSSAVSLYILYWIIKKAIDHSVTSQELTKMYQKMMDIHEELKKLTEKEEPKSSEPYTFEQLREDLTMGRELEFSYKGAVYHISRGTDGWFLTRPEGDSRFFHTHEDLLQHARIVGKPLAEIWPVVEIRVIF
jgi:uncharacterized protein YfcZ (UPF0381/DUF406 family)